MRVRRGQELMVLGEIMFKTRGVSRQNPEQSCHLHDFHYLKSIIADRLLLTVLSFGFSPK
ncbi:MAG: hypothetical protein JSU72_08395 [Deltaproteobacteria bacterium]|nr:MAG: hypothetical protein JSU72_08395 [Deltaproteobacteria bacterium]